MGDPHRLTTQRKGRYAVSSMYSVLVVDDEESIRTSLPTCYPWAQLGFVVVGQAASLTEARVLMEEQRPDVVLSDIRLGDGTGLDLAQWIRERGFPARVVLLSAYRKFEYAQDALRLGIRRYLVKPPSYDEFIELFQSLKEELDATGVASASETQSDAIEIVRAWVSGNIQIASLKQAARAVGINPSYLSTIFRERAGERFSDFVLRIRMQRAAVRLQDPLASVADVSREVGYSSPKSFARTFKAYYGRTPRCRPSPPEDAPGSESGA